MAPFAAALLLLPALASLRAEHERQPAYLVDTWTVEDGLPQNSVTSILQTRDGYLWLGTFRGPVRFDGVRFVPIAPSLTNQPVVYLYEARDGAVWIGTDGAGVFRWKNGDIRAYPPSSGVSGTVFAIAEDGNGDIWVGSSEGLGFLDGERFRMLGAAEGLPGGWVMSFSRSRDGSLWVGAQRGIVRTKGHGLVPGLPLPFPEANLNRLHEDRAGSLWVTQAEAGVAVVGGTETRRWTACKTGLECLAGNHPWPILETRSGDVWVGLGRGAGLHRIRAGRIDGTFGKADGIPANTLRALYEDREGSLWIGLAGGGLVRFRERRVAVYTTADGLPIEGVSSLVEDSEGNIWAGQCGAVSRLTGARFEPQFVREIPDLCAQTILAARGGGLWLGVWGKGLYRFKDGRVSRHSGRGGPPDVFLRALFEDAAGSFWVGTSNRGVCRLEDSGAVCYAEGQGAPSSHVNTIAQDRRGRLLVGSSAGGLARFENGVFSPLGAEVGLTSRSVQHVFVDAAGTVWVGTRDQGLFREKDGRFVRQVDDRGLVVGVAQILEDVHRNLWLGTNHGVLRLARDDLEAFAGGRIAAVPVLQFDRRDGLPTREASESFGPSGLKTRDGRLWFATIRGIVVVDPRRFSTPAEPVPLAIESLELDGGEPIVPAGAWRIPPEGRSFAIRYTALSFLNPSKLRFRYRLAGFDRSWVDAGDRRVAYYSRMAPGTYRFEVTATNDDGVWAKAPASVQFVVEPFLWETRWFRALALIGLVAATAALARWTSLRRARARLRALQHEQALERERSRIARDLHDDLGSRLSHIALMADRGPTAEQSARVSHAAREAVETLDELVWSVNARNDTVEAFAQYAARHAEEHLQAAELRCRLEIQPDLSAYGLHADARRQLFLAFKEALNNAIKHAHASEVRVSLAVRDGHVDFEVADDGCGLPDSGRDPTGNGLWNMLERMKAAGGTFQIDSTQGAGTRVAFRVPLR